jgi:hypothetical protein
MDNIFLLRDENFGLHQFGYNDDVDAAETIWSGDGAFPWADVGTNETTTIKSTDVKDDAAGVGLRTVSVIGLVNQTEADATTGQITTETVSMDGTTAVTMANKFSFIYRIVGLTAGSETDNAGDITAYHGSDDIAVMQAAENRTEMAVMVIPGFTADGHAIKGAWVLGWYAYAAKTTSAYADIVLKGMGCNSEVWSPFARGVLSQTSPIYHNFDIPKYMTPGCKVELDAEAVSAANFAISGGFYLRYDI